MKPVKMLREWVRRGPRGDRYFEIRYLNARGTNLQWAVRVESLVTSWSHDADCFETLSKATTFALKAAAEEGLE